MRKNRIVVVAATLALSCLSAYAFALPELNQNRARITADTGKVRLFRSSIVSKSLPPQTNTVDDRMVMHQFTENGVQYVCAMGSFKEAHEGNDQNWFIKFRKDNGEVVNKKSGNFFNNTLRGIEHNNPAIVPVMKSKSGKLYWVVAGKAMKKSEQGGQVAMIELTGSTNPVTLLGKGTFSVNNDDQAHSIKARTSEYSIISLHNESPIFHSSYIANEPDHDNLERKIQSEAYSNSCAAALRFADVNSNVERSSKKLFAIDNFMDGANEAQHLYGQFKVANSAGIYRYAYADDYAALDYRLEDHEKVVLLRLLKLSALFHNPLKLAGEQDAYIVPNYAKPAFFGGPKVGQPLSSGQTFGTKPLSRPYASGDLTVRVAWEIDRDFTRAQQDQSGNVIKFSDKAGHETLKFTFKNIPDINEPAKVSSLPVTVSVYINGNAALENAVVKMNTNNATTVYGNAASLWRKDINDGEGFKKQTKLVTANFVFAYNARSDSYELFFEDTKIGGGKGRPAAIDNITVNNANSDYGLCIKKIDVLNSWSANIMDVYRKNWDMSKHLYSILDPVRYTWFDLNTPGSAVPQPVFVNVPPKSLWDYDLTTIKSNGIEYKLSEGEGKTPSVSLKNYVRRADAKRFILMAGNFTNTSDNSVVTLSKWLELSNANSGSLLPGDITFENVPANLESDYVLETNPSGGSLINMGSSGVLNFRTATKEYIETAYPDYFQAALDNEFDKIKFNYKSLAPDQTGIATLTYAGTNQLMRTVQFDQINLKTPNEPTIAIGVDKVNAGYKTLLGAANEENLAVICARSTYGSIYGFSANGESSGQLVSRTASIYGGKSVEYNGQTFVAFWGYPNSVMVLNLTKPINTSSVGLAATNSNPRQNFAVGNKWNIFGDFGANGWLYTVGVNDRTANVTDLTGFNIITNERFRIANGIKGWDNAFVPLDLCVASHNRIVAIANRDDAKIYYYKLSGAGNNDNLSLGDGVRMTIDLKAMLNVDIPTAGKMFAMGNDLYGIYKNVMWKVSFDAQGNVLSAKHLQNPDVYFGGLDFRTASNGSIIKISSDNFERLQQKPLVANNRAYMWLKNIRTNSLTLISVDENLTVTPVSEKLSKVDGDEGGRWLVKAGNNLYFVNGAPVGNDSANQGQLEIVKDFFK